MAAEQGGFEQPERARDSTGIVAGLVAGGTRRGRVSDPVLVVRREACLPRSYPTGVSARGPRDPAGGSGGSSQGGRPSGEGGRFVAGLWQRQRVAGRTDGASP